MNRLLILLLVILSGTLSGQTDPSMLGLTCDSAVSICNIGVLDGFHSELPDSNNFFGQPSPLCNGSGTPDNIFWFSFVAGSDSISLTITPSNCFDTLGNPDDLGIQAGIYDDCQFQNSLDCNFNGVNGGLNPLTISSGAFVIGQTYYFFVDGHSGNVCEFDVKLNYGAQPLDLGDLVAFDQGNQTDTICPSQDNFVLGIANYPIDIQFLWNVSCSNPAFNPIIWKNLGNTEKFILPLEGIYTFEMLATNVCDTTNIISKQVVVQKLDNELFTPVQVCANDFPYAGPKDENPNGDSVVGWLGPNINVTGIATYNVTQSNGCKYNQTVQVSAIPLSPRERVTAVDCEPFDYHGILVFNNLLGLNISLDNLASNGCDSLVELDAYILDIQGSLGIKECADNQIVVAFNQSFISAPPGYTLDYAWRWANGTPILDNNATPGDIEVSQQGEIYLTISINYQGKSCNFEIASIIVDPTALKPEVPTITDWDLILCESNMIGSYSVSVDPSVDKYHWIIPAGAIILGDSTSSSIQVDFSNAASYQLCIAAVNGCGESTQVCRDITKVKIPNTSIASPDSACADSVITIAMTSNIIPNASYTWTLSSNILVSGNLNSPNPITIRASEGRYNLSLMANDRGCTNVENKEIVISKNVEIPIINCNPEADKIIFDWQVIDCALSYNCYVDDVFLLNTTEPKLEVSNLLKEEDVKVRVEVVSQCPCSNSFAEISCSALACNFVSINASAPKYLICEDDWTMPIPLSILISGNLTSNGTQLLQGVGLSGNLFNPAIAGPGVHEITASYSELGCVFIDTIQISLVENPTVNVLVTDPSCKEELYGTIIAKASGGDGNYTYYMDDEIIGENVTQIPIGAHTIRIIDGNNCSDNEVVTILSPIYPEFMVNGKSDIFDNQSGNFNIEMLNDNKDLIDSIAWYINGELICTGVNCFDVHLNPMPEGEYVHEVIVFYKDCSLTDEFMLRVKEAPKLTVANIFSPNGDGDNDFWEIGVNKDYVKIEQCSIFSRWGEKIFNKKQLSPYEDSRVWDGKFNGQDLMPGVYVFSISYYNEFGTLITITGDLTLIR